MEIKIQKWEMVGIAISVILFGVFLYRQLDWDTKFVRHELPDNIQRKMSVLRLKNIELVAIPDEVYESFKESPADSEYFQGEKKSLVAVVTANSAYKDDFKQTFNEMLSHEAHQRHYRQQVFEVDPANVIWCDGPLFCSKKWIGNNCSKGLCIINPATHEALIDNSLDVRQIPFLLTALKEW